MIVSATFQVRPGVTATYSAPEYQVTYEPTLAAYSVVFGVFVTRFDDTGLPVGEMIPCSMEYSRRDFVAALHAWDESEVSGPSLNDCEE